MKKAELKKEIERLKTELKDFKSNRKDEKVEILMTEIKCFEEKISSLGVVNFQFQMDFTTSDFGLDKYTITFENNKL